MNERIDSADEATSRTRAVAPRSWPLIIGSAFALLGMATLVASQWLAHRHFHAGALPVTEGEARSARLGETLAQRIPSLNSALFEAHLRNDNAAREAFSAESRRLLALISEAKAVLPTEDERESAAALGAALKNYLSEADQLEPLRGLRRDSVEVLAGALKAQVAPLIAAANKLAVVQAAEAHNRAGDLSQITFTGLAFVGAAFFLMFYSAVAVPRKLRQELSAIDANPLEKLESLSVLAAGVAHEIRNPLTAIKFRLFSLKKGFGAELADSEDYQTIRSEIDRLELIVKSFLQFARPPDPEIASVSAPELFKHVRELLDPEMARRNIRFVVDAAEPITFAADRQQLEQVLINLAQNAADSMPSGGAITLRARTGAASLAQRSEPVVLLEVTDTGSGIPDEIQKRLFDPFFSTKEGGTGLGLAIAARIVEKNGGRMQFSTRKNQGTTFTVVLPRGTEDR